MLTSQRVHPPREPTYSGEVAAGYMKSCLPFAIGATVTVAVVSLDIVTDWIMYKAVLDNNIPSAVKSYTASHKPGDAAENDIVWTLRNVYIRLPGLMQGLLILGSFVFCLYFWWLCFMLVEQRKKFKDKRDGVPRKKTIYERYGGEVLIFLHVLCEDLPVSVILLLAQMSCSCTFFFNFDHVIYLIATCTTAFSFNLEICTGGVELRVLQFPGQLPMQPRVGHSSHSVIVVHQFHMGLDSHKFCTTSCGQEWTVIFAYHFWYICFWQNWRGPLHLQSRGYICAKCQFPICYSQ